MSQAIGIAEFWQKGLRGSTQSAPTVQDLRA
jgi:hypothetical protein